MQRIITLIVFLFSLVSYAKEITSSSVDKSLIIINVKTSTSLEEAMRLPKILGDKYDVLTLKGNAYNQYLVNILPESAPQALKDAQQFAPNAHLSNKKVFYTDGIILLSTNDNMVENQNITNNTLSDINVSQIPSEDNTTKLNTFNQNFENQQTALENFLLQGDSNSTLTEHNASNRVQNSEQAKTDKIKIDLIDAVLQTLSISHKAMSSREKMIQAKHNIDIAYANYYPSIDASYTLGKTNLKPGNKRTDQTREKTKYYGDEIYSLTLSQNIYAGGETENEIERLKVQYLLAKTDYEKLLEEETLKAINAYIDVVFTRDSVEVNQKNMEELETIFDIVKTKYDAGALSIGELSSIEASISNAKSQLSRTNSRSTNALEYFKFITGEAFSDTYPHEKVTQVAVENFDSIYENALLQNSNLRAYNYEILSSKFNLKKLKSAFRPKVNIVLGSDKVNDKEDFEVQEDSYYAKLMVTYNLYNGGKDQKQYLKAFSIIQEKSFDKEAEIRKIKWGLEKLHTSLTSLQGNLGNVEHEVNASRSMVGSYWESFRHGEQDLHVLLQAQRQLNTAELDFIQSQQDSMKDFFEILHLSGDILHYFHIDINDENYLDLAKASYRIQMGKKKNTIKNEYKVQESPIKKPDDNATITTVENKVDINDKNESMLNSLLSFHERFLMEDENRYTIVISELKNPLDGLKTISQLHIEKNAFIYEYYKNKKIQTNIAYGIFTTLENANSALNSELKATKRDHLSIERIGKVRKDFRDFSALQFINANEIQIPKVIEIKEELPFATNEIFKEKFISAPKEYFSINLTTLSSMEEAGILVKNAHLEDNSFAFSFGKKHEWIKLMVGVYPTYDEAKEAVKSLGNFNLMYMPVIEKIGLKQTLYKKFNNK